MEGRLRYSALIAALLMLASSPAYAYEDVETETNDEGVRVELTVGEDGSVSVGGGRRTDSSCEWSVIQYPFTGNDPPARYGAPPSSDHRLYLVFCDGEFVTSQWLGPGENSTIIDTRALANTVIETIPVDLASINARPQAEAITGIPSYFWVEGYDGAPITGSVTNGPVTVDVTVSLGTVTWDFGDGTPPYTGNLGEAWPDRSSVRHTYKDKGAYIVTVTIVLPAEFTVNGSGVVTQLPPVIRTAQFPYQVDEVQAVRER